MDQAECRHRFASVTVARMATVTATGAPHLVPITFVLLENDVILTAVDHKPKRSRALARLDNIAADSRVSVLADHYDSDWSRLWWVRADGRAQVLERVEAAALEPLADRYPAYRGQPPEGPFIAITVARFAGWSAR